MKTRLPARKNSELTRAEFQELIMQFADECYQLFIEDYPKNRDYVLSIFDEALDHSSRPRVIEYWTNIKNTFLEIEKR
ncbi:MAG: hypothetical protein ACR2L1_03530 [Pyrinomonadaceae bacterium]